MNKDELIQNLSEKGLSKPLPHPFKQSLAWIVCILLYMIVAATVEGFRFDINSKLQSITFIAEILLLLAISFSATIISIYYSRPDNLSYKPLRFIPFLLLVIWFFVAYSDSMYMLSVDNFIASLKSKGFMCTCHIMLITALPLIILFFFLRMGASVQHGWAGAMATLGITSFTYLFMRLIEPNDDIVHLITWHAFPIILMCLLAIKLSKLLLKW